jgi:hypothetical protein
MRRVPYSGCSVLSAMLSSRPALSFLLLGGRPGWSRSPEGPLALNFSTQRSTVPAPAPSMCATSSTDVPRSIARTALSRVSYE